MTDPPGIEVSRVKSRILDSLGVPGDVPWYAAYSGGLDSTVLLHLLAAICREAGIRLIALHADHGLHPCSGEWRRLCEQRCRAWGLECLSRALDLEGGGGLGPEGRARAARYRWFRAAAGEGAWLFTAHHRRDQAETVLERLTRGAGPRGLRGIRPLAGLHGMHVVRPLLEWPREALQAYAERHDLDWVTDDANRDPRFTRNFIRARVLPVLTERWPGIEAALGRTARVMADTQRILDETADADLAGLDPREIRGDPSLNIDALAALPRHRQRNTLRHWLHGQTGESPGLERLDRIVDAVARHPRDPGGLRWPPIDLRPFRGRLYLVRAWRPPEGERPWDLAGELKAADGLVLRARAQTGAGLRREALPASVTVRFRRGGEKCRLPGRRHRHALKQVLQEAGVPPWQRPRVPLVTIDGEIAAVPGVACCGPWAAGSGDPGVTIEAIYDWRAP